MSPEILTLKEVFQISSDGKLTAKWKNGRKCFGGLSCVFMSADHDTAINRYSRLSKKKDNDKVRNVAAAAPLMVDVIILLGPCRTSSAEL